MSLKVILISANRADPDEMQHYAAFYLGLNYLPKYQFRGFKYTKSYSSYTLYRCILFQWLIWMLRVRIGIK